MRDCLGMLAGDASGGIQGGHVLPSPPPFSVPTAGHGHRAAAWHWLWAGVPLWASGQDPMQEGGTGWGDSVLLLPPLGVPYQLHLHGHQGEMSPACLAAAGAVAIAQSCTPHTTVAAGRGNFTLAAMAAWLGWDSWQWQQCQVFPPHLPTPDPTLWATEALLLRAGANPARVQPCAPCCQGRNLGVHMLAHYPPDALQMVLPMPTPFPCRAPTPPHTPTSCRGELLPEGRE